MLVRELISELLRYRLDDRVSFSMANDDTEDPGERWFADTGLEDVVQEHRVITLCMVGVSNLRPKKRKKKIPGKGANHGRSNGD